MIDTPVPGEIDLSQDPNVFPYTGLSLAVWWLAVVDGLMPWDRARAKIAPSVVLLTLVMNVLTQRNPFYRVEDWVATLPLPLLWGDTIKASQFNDDALGRVLEDLADHGQVAGHVGHADASSRAIGPPSSALGYLCYGIVWRLS